MPGKGLERRYTEEEVAHILQQAVQGGEASGLTLRQLEEIGREVGIAPEAIRAAAARTSIVHQPTSGLFGAPSVVQHERHLAGTVRPDQREGIVLAIRRAMGRHGVVTQTADGVEWKARDATGGRYVTVSTSSGGTVVRGLGNFRDIIGFAVGAVGFITFFGTLILLKKLGAPGLGLAPLLTLGSWFTGRLFWRRKFRDEQRALDAAVNDVSRYLEATDEPPPTLPQG